MIEQDRLNRIRELREQSNPTFDIGSDKNQIDENFISSIKKKREENINTVSTQTRVPQQKQQTQQQQQQDQGDDSQGFLSKVGGFVKELIAPTRGFSDEELSKAKPTMKETANALLSYPAEQADAILTFAGDILFGNEANRMRKNGVPEEEVLAYEQRMAEYHQQFAPKTPGEARVMQGADVATLFFPVGKVGAIDRATANSVELAVRKSAQPKTIQAIIDAKGNIPKAVADTRSQTVIKDLSRMYKVPEDQVTDTFVRSLQQTKDPNAVKSIFGNYNVTDDIQVQSLSEQIASTKKTSDIAATLKGNIADDQVSIISRVLKNVDDPETVNRILNDYGVDTQMSLPVETPKVNTVVKETLPKIDNAEVQRVQQDFDYTSYVRKNTQKESAARISDKGTFSDRAKKFASRFMSNAVDSQSIFYNTLRNAEKKGYKVPVTYDYRNQSAVVIRASEIANDFMKNNDFENIIKEVDDLDNLDQYLKAKRNVELYNQGRDVAPGRNIADDLAAIAAGSQKYEKYATRFRDYTHKLLDYAVHTGIKGRDEVERSKAENPNYVPFDRIFSDEEAKLLEGTFGAKSIAGLSNQTVFRRLKGSEREIENVFASMREKTLQLFLQGERNKAGQIVASYENIPYNPMGIRKLKEGEKLSPAKTQFSFYKNGAKQTYEIAPEFERAMKNLDSHELGLIGQMLAVPARIAKAGITGLNLAFIAPNIVADQVGAFINADNALAGSPLNIKNFYESLLGIMNHDDLYKAIRKQGGSYTSWDYWRNAYVKDVEAIRSSRSIPSRVKYTAKNPGQLLRQLEDVVAKSEEITRAQYARAEYKAQIKAGKTKEEAATKAAQIYREVTTDFMRSGDVSKVLNNALIYFNPSVQGARTLMKNLRDKPVKTTAKIVGTTMMPVVYITAWNLSDEKRREAYLDIPEWEKDNNIIFIPPNPEKDENGKWNVIKIKINPSVSSLVRPVRRVQESMAGLEPVKFNEFAQALFQTATGQNFESPTQFAGNVVPQAMKPTIEVVQNKQFYTGAPVVPEQLVQQAPEAQVFTSETASGFSRTPTSGTIRRIASKVGLSPIKTEYWINNTFGGISHQIINNVDKLASEVGIIPEDEIGGRGVRKDIARRFTKAYGGAETQKMYEERAKKIKEISRVPKGPEQTAAAQEYIASIDSEDRNSAKFALFNAGISTKGVSTSQDIIDILPVFNQVKDIALAGNKQEASRIIKSLSKEDIKKYKKALTAHQRIKTNEQVEQMEEVVEQVRKITLAGDKEQALSIIKSLSPEEQKLFAKAKKNLGY